MYSAVNEWNVLINVSQIKWVGSGIQVLLLIFYALDLSIIERRVVKCATIIVGLSTSSCSSISFGFLYVEALLLDVYRFRIDIFSF